MPVSRRKLLRHAIISGSGGMAGCAAPASDGNRSPISSKCDPESADFTGDATFTIVANGAPNHKIQVSKDASDTVLFAATELQEYLQKVSGARLPIVTDRGSDQVIKLQVADVDADCSEKVVRDAFEIDASEEETILRGGTPRATLYAAYDLLERYVGICWPAPGQDGEVVPSKDSLSIPNVTETRAADFAYRVAGVFKSEEYIDWAVKNKLHPTRYATAGQSSEKYIEKRGGYVFDTNVHSFFDIVPPEQYAEDHPEFYVGFENGDPTGQLDPSAPGLADEIANSAIGFFEEHPDAELFPVTPNDGYGWPDSASQQEHLDAHKRRGHPRVFKHHPVVSDAYFDLVNRVARKVREEYPGKKIYSLAYINYVFPPATFRELEPNVVVSVAHYAPADYAHPIGSPNSTQNTQFEDILQEWANLTENRWIYAYTVKYALDHLPFPIAYRLAEDIDLLRRTGHSGFFSQGGEGRWGQCGPHFYAMAKLLWDTDRSIESILDEYFNAMFGGAAEPMRQCYDHLADALSQPEVYLNRHPRTQARDFLTPAVLSTAQGYIDDALDAAATPRERRNIREMGIPIEYAPLYFRMREALHAYESSGELADLKRAVAAFNEIRGLIQRNRGVDAIPGAAITKEGYFTLQKYFRPHMEKINTSGEWEVVE